MMWLIYLYAVLIYIAIYYVSRSKSQFEVDVILDQQFYNLL